MRRRPYHHPPSSPCPPLLTLSFLAPPALPLYCLPASHLPCPLEQVVEEFRSAALGVLEDLASQLEPLWQQLRCGEQQLHRMLLCWVEGGREEKERLVGGEPRGPCCVKPELLAQALLTCLCPVPPPLPHAASC